jgi:hypothetical protein
VCRAGLALFWAPSYSVSFCLFALFLQATFLFSIFSGLFCKKRGVGVSRQYGNATSSVGMGLVVNIHQLADRGVGVLLRGGERLVAEQLLNGAQVGAIGQQVRRKSVTQ